MTKMPASTAGRPKLIPVERSPVLFQRIIGSPAALGATTEGRRSPAPPAPPAAAYNRAVRSLIRILLPALAILAPVIASPAAASYAETRVWGFELEEPARARAQPTLSETCIEGYPPAYDGFMVGCSPVPRGTAGDAAHNVNSQSALRSKLSGLQKAQQNAARVRELPDGRVRYYTKEVAASKEGPTRGASFVTEYNPQTGQTRQWMESYDHAGEVVRTHPKTIDGQVLDAPHFPPTKSELQ